MAYCCVPGCTSYQHKDSDKKLSFHRFPSDPKACREWIVKIRRDIGPHFQITDNTRVCSKHFTQDCIVRSLTGLNRLKQGSVPTVFTWCRELKPRRTLQRSQRYVNFF
ncbi:THAP domain-containing protein 2 [Labeo rohita]|uniref:THAP domain-containing protein 1 n=1 Tax=Labeo rohita TaxID=84645 RepID=A0ABQ8MVQ6_LABRO|nr:THAP domain-containing protein 2 [Labeo rohita]